MKPYFQLWSLFNPCKTGLITSLGKEGICLIKLLKSQQTLLLCETTAHFVRDKDEIDKNITKLQSFFTFNKGFSDFNKLSDM